MKLEFKNNYITSIVHDGFWQVAFQTKVSYILTECLIASIILWIFIRQRRKKKPPTRVYCYYCSAFTLENEYVKIKVCPSCKSNLIQRYIKE